MDVFKTPTIMAIINEIEQMKQDKTPALWLRITHPVWNTVRLETQRVKEGLIWDKGVKYADSFRGIPVYKYPTGSIDSPGFQLMSTPYKKKD